MTMLKLFVGTLKRYRHHQRYRAALVVLSLFAVGLLFRLPQLLNPALLNSDVAIVGLQARHFLQGEFSLFLWGTDYQSSFDALVLAPFFFLFGATPTSAMLGPLLGYFAILALTYDLLRRNMAAWKAVSCCLLLVFTPRSVSQYVVYAPRIWSVVAVFLSIWLLDRSARSKHTELLLGLGGCVIVLSTFLDMYTLQWVPAVLVFGLFCCFDIADGWRNVIQRTVASGAGVIIGFGIIALLRVGRGKASVTKLDVSRISHNFELLSEQCWPWLFDFKGDIRLEGVNADIYQAAVLGRALQTTGVLVAVGLLLFSGVALFWKTIPWNIRRIGALASGTALCSVGGFLVSASPVDVYSARYLTPVIWMLPFAAASVVTAIRTHRGFITLMAPYYVVVLFSAWSVYVGEIDGLVPKATPSGNGEQEYVLRDWLRSNRIRYAMARYWDSYRLAFLFKERPQVIPFDLGQDRHQETRDEFFREKRTAYIFRSDGPSRAERVEMRSRHDEKGHFSDHVIAGYNVVLWESSSLR